MLHLIVSQCEIFYYLSPNGDNPFSDFLDSLFPKQQSKILRIINTIRNYGLSSALPHLKKLENTPFWEIRILGKDNLRAIYISPHQNSVVILHGFVKKSQKTPPKELNIAQTRYQDWCQHHLDK